MSHVYLKQLKGQERRELHLDPLEGLTVKNLRETVSEAVGIPLEELTLIFNGRVLKLSKSISSYNIGNGCTIFYTRKVSKTLVTQSDAQEHSSSFNTLISNRRLLTVIGSMLSNPSLLQAMLAGTPLEGNQALSEALQSPELLSSLSNPDTIEEYLRDNPHMAALMESMLRAYQFGVGSEGGEESEGVRAVSGEGSEDSEGVGEVNMEIGQEERIRMAQEQEAMFQHSQAIHAHQRQVQVTTPTHQDSPDGQSGPNSQPPSGDSSLSQTSSVQTQNNSGGAITQDLLASALAGVMTTQTSPLSRLGGTNSGPSSVSHPNSWPVQASNGRGRSEQAGTITTQHQQITGTSFQQSLSSVMAPSTANTQREMGQRSTPQEKYRAQLEQLHLMGIVDDGLSIQALELARGDIQAALEIIYSS